MRIAHCPNHMGYPGNPAFRMHGGARWFFAHVRVLLDGEPVKRWVHADTREGVVDRLLWREDLPLLRLRQRCEETGSWFVTERLQGVVEVVRICEVPPKKAEPIEPVMRGSYMALRFDARWVKECLLMDK